MDDELKKKLIVIAAIFVAVIGIYYLTSPYQNCMRSTDAKNSFKEDPSRLALFCTKFTRW